MMPDRAGWNLDAEALAAFGAAGVQYFSPSLGSHTGTEAMSALALKIARLKSSLHSRASDWRVLKGAAILGRGYGAVNFLSVPRCGSSDPASEILGKTLTSKKLDINRTCWLLVVGDARFC